MTAQNIAIIGAGATGLAAAWDFARAGHTVTLYEAAANVGGLAAGFKEPNWEWTLEKFYHHWFESDKDILGLLDEMGLRDQVIFPRPKTSFWINGKMYRSEISPSALFLPLSPLSIIRMGLSGVYLKLTRLWRPLEQVTADAWMRKYMGDEAYGKFFRPLLIGKFGEDYNKINMAWLWARIASRTLRLGTFTGGFQRALDSMAEKLTGLGVIIRLNSPVEKLRIENGKPVLTVNGADHPYDAVLSTTSPQLMLKLTEGLAETAYGQQVAALKSIGGLCVVLATNQQLLTDGTYWLNLPATTADKQKNEFPFLALVEHTNYMDKVHYGGDHILYCGDYVPVDHEYFRLSDDELVARFLPALKKVNPAFNESWIRKSWVWRALYAQPMPFLNHSQNIPALQTPLPQVYWASMSQVYPWDRGTNYSVEMGRRVAKDMMAAQ